MNNEGGRKWNDKEESGLIRNEITVSTTTAILSLLLLPYYDSVGGERVDDLDGLNSIIYNLSSLIHNR